MHLKDVSSRIHQIMNPQSLGVSLNPSTSPQHIAGLQPGQTSETVDQIQSLSPAGRLKPISVLLNEPIEGLQAEPGVSASTQTALNTVPGSKWAGFLNGNGSRETAIILPKGFDASKPAEVIFYFHGHHGTIANTLTDPKKGMNQAIQELATRKNAIVVIPQGPPKEHDFKWFNPLNKESLVDFQKDALEQIQQMAPGVQLASITLKGHSAGGLALMNSLTDSAKKGGLQVDRVDVLDGSYGYWASSAWQGLKKLNPDAQMNVLYIPNSKTEADALRLKNIKQVKLQSVLLGHGDFPKTFIGQ